MLLSFLIKELKKDHGFHKNIKAAKTVFNIDNNEKYSWAANQHISMISEGYFFKILQILLCAFIKRNYSLLNYIII